MKLNPVHRAIAMRHRHDDAVRRLGVDDELRRQRLRLDHERVVPRGAHRQIAVREQPLAAMHNLGDLAVYRHAAADDARAERLADRLVAEADAEERDVAVAAYEVDAAAGAGGRSGSGRDDDRARSALDQRRGVERIVADDRQRDAGKAFDLLDQVVGEGVVVVDYDNGVVSGRAKDASRPCSSTRSPEEGTW